jgi:hypothetical protein
MSNPIVFVVGEVSSVGDIICPQEQMQYVAITARQLKKEHPNLHFDHKILTGGAYDELTYGQSVTWACNNVALKALRDRLYPPVQVTQMRKRRNK